MSLPYTTTADLPQGLETVEIDLITYVVDAVSDPGVSSRVISRTDGVGDIADFMLRNPSEPLEVTMTLQRATTTTVRPPAGTEFSYDFDRSGTDSTLVVSNNPVTRDKGDFDTFEVTALIVTYQG